MRALTLGVLLKFSETKFLSCKVESMKAFSQIVWKQKLNITVFNSKCKVLRLVPGTR